MEINAIYHVNGLPCIVCKLASSAHCYCLGNLTYPLPLLSVGRQQVLHRFCWFSVDIMYTVYFIKRSGKFAKSDYKLCLLLALFFCLSVCLSVSAQATTLLTLNGFSWNSIFYYFSKISRQNLILIKIWQQYGLHCAQNYVRVWHSVAEIFLQREVFQIKAAGKVKPHILFSMNFSSENRDV